MKKMKSTTVYNRWDIVLVNFPFTDLSAVKKRPCLILSTDDFNKSSDVIAAYITSNIPDDKRIGDYMINDWMEAGLPKPSLIRMKIATIDKSIINKKIGSLNQYDIKRFKKVFQDFFLK